MKYPNEEKPHCKKCELPKDVCACADAREHDRAWKRGRR